MSGRDLKDNTFQLSQFSDEQKNFREVTLSKLLGGGGPVLGAVNYTMTSTVLSLLQGPW